MSLLSAIIGKIDQHSCEKSSQIMMKITKIIIQYVIPNRLKFNKEKKLQSRLHKIPQPKFESRRANRHRIRYIIPCT